MPKPRTSKTTPEALKNIVAELQAGTEPPSLSEAEVLQLAYDAGLAAGEAVPEGRACGRGDVMRPGERDYVNEPLLSSPFGQDYDRHVAFARAAVAVLKRHGIPASARVELD